jgi:hypothetical protein
MTLVITINVCLVPQHRWLLALISANIFGLTPKNFAVGIFSFVAVGIFYVAVGINILST